MDGKKRCAIALRIEPLCSAEKYFVENVQITAAQRMAGGPVRGQAGGQPVTKNGRAGGARTFVWDASFNTFGDGLTALRGFLRVAVGRTGIHRAGRAHAAIRLEGASLI